MQRQKTMTEVLNKPLGLFAFLTGYALCHRVGEDFLDSNFARYLYPSPMRALNPYHRQSEKYVSVMIPRMRWRTLAD